MEKLREIRQNPAQDSQFAFILWYVAKKIISLQELRILSSRRSSNYFDNDINLVYVSQGGINYCKVHL